MKIPLFDIDGTLIESGSPIHREAFRAAFGEVYSLPDASLTDMVCDGMIDNQILVEIAALHGMDRRTAIAKLPAALEVMARYFLAHADETPPVVLPGVRELLERLSTMRIVCGVLTGNHEPIGWEKLRRAELAKYIQFGAFGNAAMKRSELLPVAARSVSQVLGSPVMPTDFVIIGDSPRDIACAREGGVPVVAVATGRYSLDELAAESPDALFANLADDADLIEAIHAF